MLTSYAQPVRIWHVLSTLFCAVQWYQQFTSGWPWRLCHWQFRTRPRTYTRTRARGRLSRARRPVFAIGISYPIVITTHGRLSPLKIEHDTVANTTYLKLPLIARLYVNTPRPIFANSSEENAIGEVELRRTWVKLHLHSQYRAIIDIKQIKTKKSLHYFKFFYEGG